MVVSAAEIKILSWILAIQRGKGSREALMFVCNPSIWCTHGEHFWSDTELFPSYQCASNLLTAELQSMFSGGSSQTHGPPGGQGLCFISGY